MAGEILVTKVTAFDVLGTPAGRQVVTNLAAYVIIDTTTPVTPPDPGPSGKKRRQVQVKT